MSVTPMFEVVDPATLQTQAKIELSNTCQCMICPECTILYPGADYGEACDECEGPLDFGDCGGDCWTEGNEEVKEFLAQWMELNPSPTGKYMIEGKGMGWRHLSGITLFDPAKDDAVAKVSVDSDFTQNWEIDVRKGGTARATQSHHDAMGEVYTFRPATAREVAAHAWS